MRCVSFIKINYRPDGSLKQGNQTRMNLRKHVLLIDDRFKNIPISIVILSPVFVVEKMGESCWGESKY